MMQEPSLEERIKEAGFNPDAVIGMAHDGRLVYDYDLMVKSLASSDGTSEEEAAEFIDYNTIRSLPYVGRGAPVVISRFVEEG